MTAARLPPKRWSIWARAANRLVAADILSVRGPGGAPSPHPGADLQQLCPDRGALGPGVGGAGQPQTAQPVHQQVGEGGKIQPQLIGLQRGATGAVGEQAQLLLLR